MEAEYIKELTETTALSKSNTKRLDKLEERQDNLEKLTQAVTVVQTKQEQIETDVGEIKTDVKALREKPSKWWDKLIVALIGAAVGYVVKALWGIG